MRNMTEDEVRTQAQKILGFYPTEEAKSDVGQITTFGILGFTDANKKKIQDKPDGWYLPKDSAQPAIILEVKSTKIDLRQPQIDEIKKNCSIVMSKYNKVIGILYNGEEIKVFKNNEEINTVEELQNKEYYLSLFKENRIDKQKIYNITKQINDCLHFKFMIRNLSHRMIFTACALVAERYGAKLENVKDMGFNVFRNVIFNTLSTSYKKSKKLNTKLDVLLDVYSQIRINVDDTQETIKEAINNFIDWVVEISDLINSDYWNGEDVMAIFFNEFNRYKKKTEAGQVFTPDHITSLMYRLIRVNQNDIVLDAACGSGAFLVKSMCNMIKEAGGVTTDKAKKIKQEQLYGIEIDREIFALACANMLIHKDGTSNLMHMDAKTDEAHKWINSKNITKVLMNPPFERNHS